MKKIYQTPTCEVIEIELENILCDSLWSSYEEDDQLKDLYRDYL